MRQAVLTSPFHLTAIMSRLVTPLRGQNLTRRFNNYFGRFLLNFYAIVSHLYRKDTSGSSSPSSLDEGLYISFIHLIFPA